MQLLQLCLLSCFFLLFLKKSLLNSVKLALLLILWSFLSVLIEVHPLAQRRGKGRFVFVTRTHAFIVTAGFLVHHSVFSYRDKRSSGTLACDSQRTTVRTTECAGESNE